MIVAFTGAGISKQSGISTFDEQPGLREKLDRNYANENTEDYFKTLRIFIEGLEGKEPNDAHLALAEYNIPIITMNVDKLHQAAGSTNVIEMHGQLPTLEEIEEGDLSKLVGKPILYGDTAPGYQEAFNLVTSLGNQDILLLIGISGYTQVVSDIKSMAFMNGTRIVEINDDAAGKVRNALKSMS